MTERFTYECGCEIAVYGDRSAPPDIEYCDDHGERSPETRVFEALLSDKPIDALALLEQMDKASLIKLRRLGQDIEIHAENAYFAQSRKDRAKRGD